jgi:hypothetical protein
MEAYRRHGVSFVGMEVLDVLLMSKKKLMHSENKVWSVLQNLSLNGCPRFSVHINAVHKHARSPWIVENLLPRKRYSYLSNS